MQWILAKYGTIYTTGYNLDPNFVHILAYLAFKFKVVFVVV